MNYENETMLPNTVEYENENYNDDNMLSHNSKLTFLTQQPEFTSMKSHNYSDEYYFSSQVDSTEEFDR